MIRTPADAVQAIFAIAAWGGAHTVTAQEIANLLAGMELALNYPEWCLALLNLAGREPMRTVITAQVKTFVDACPIETEVLP